MRILVSGFEQFGGETINPTSLLMDEVEQGRVRFPEKVSVRSVKLPVTYEGAFRVLDDLTRSFDPDVILSFGLAIGRDAIDLERVAINCMDAKIADNNGVHHQGVAIDPLSENAYFATLPLQNLVAALEKEKIPARISNTAGTYVCNYLLFRVLESNLRTRRRCGFVHVPFLPEQVSSRPQTPSLPLSVMVRALETMIKELTA